MNWQPFETWWLAQSRGVRMALAALLAAACIACAILFLHYDLRSEHSAALDRTEFTIGKPDAWLRWNKTGMHDPGTFGFTRESGIHLFTLSFGAGVIAYACAVLLVRIGRCGKRANTTRQ